MFCIQVAEASAGAKSCGGAPASRTTQKARARSVRYIVDDVDTAGRRFSHQGLARSSKSTPGQWGRGSRLSPRPDAPAPEHAFWPRRWRRPCPTDGAGRGNRIQLEGTMTRRHRRGAARGGPVSQRHRHWEGGKQILLDVSDRSCSAAHDERRGCSSLRVPRGRWQRRCEPTGTWCADDRALAGAVIEAVGVEGAPWCTGSAGDDHGAARRGDWRSAGCWGAQPVFGRRRSTARAWS